jgi:hypothetical protein
MSADEIKEIIRFYESPVGRKMVETGPKIMADFSPKVMQLTREIMHSVMEKMKEKGQQ